MHAKIIIAALIALACSEMGRAAHEGIAAKQLGLLKLVLDTRAATSEQQKACMDYYFPEAQAISTEYDSKMTSCRVSAEQARANIEQNSEPLRKNIDTMSDAVCQDLMACKTYKGIEDYLDCCGKTGNNDVSMMYSISGNATAAKSAVHNEMQRIDSEQDNCQIQAFESYQQKWNVNAQAWNDCNAGTIQAPTATTTTTAAPTTTPTTTTTSTTTTTTPAPTKKPPPTF